MNFFDQVYKYISTIPVGKVMTYGQVAKALGTRDARRVGHALHANKNPLVPCHRVVMKDGSMAPGYAFGGPEIQKEKLLNERVVFINNKADLIMSLS